MYFLYTYVKNKTKHGWMIEGQYSGNAVYLSK